MMEAIAETCVLIMSKVDAVTTVVLFLTVMSVSCVHILTATFHIWKCSPLSV